MTARTSRMRAVKIKSALVGGKSLRQAAELFDLSPERCRKIIAAYPDLHEEVTRARDRRRDAARAARERDRQGASTRSRSTPKTSTAIYTDDQLDGFARSFFATGETSSFRFGQWLRANAGPSLQTFNRFGRSWADICRHYGVEPPGSGRGRKSVGADVCLDAVKRVERKVGRPPTLREYVEHRRPEDPSPKTVARALGDGLWSGVVALLDTAEAA